MNFSGFGMNLGFNRDRKPTQTCERCGLLSPIDEEECIHCGKLDEAQLHELKQKLLNNEESTRSLGGIFFILSLVVIVILAISYMA